jgi:hypothetical protein
VTITNAVGHEAKISPSANCRRCEEKMSQNDWPHDTVLEALANVEGPVADLVRAFPGRAAGSESTDWLDDWFRNWVRAVAHGSQVPKVTLRVSGPKGTDLSILDRQPVSVPVRLISIKPHYFRGFRKLEAAIQMDADLVVFQGRNSSGKTSISEALEWLITGALSRREIGQLGHPRELENCISHQFRPKGETTRVEASVSVNEEVHQLCRILKKDYSAKQKATNTSMLQIDGRDLSANEERELLDRLFAGVNPLLMQHTLRQFVNDSPSHRRIYFERLLQIDELTALIEKAVITTTRFTDFPPPAGQLLSTAWEEVKRAAHTPALELMRHAEKAAHGETTAAVRKALLTSAKVEFPSECQGAPTLKHAREALLAAQERSREEKFPLLKVLRPPRGADAVSRFLEGEQRQRPNVLAARSQLIGAHQAATAVKDANLAIAAAFEQLVAAQLIDPVLTGPQQCPMCEFRDEPTLSVARIKEILSWTPISEALDNASRDWLSVSGRYNDLLDGLERAIASALPPAPSGSSLEALSSSAAPKLYEAVMQATAESERLRPSVEPAVAAIRHAKQILAESPPTTDESTLQIACDDVRESLTPVSNAIHRYADAFHNIEQLVASEARSSQGYAIREAWLTASSDLPAVGECLQWERAKGEVQTLLSTIRTGLIDLRATLVNDIRDRFSADMTSVWGLLRSDRATKFSRLDIPPVRGRGFKLEFGVKAILSGTDEDKEIDALRVMSESQINAIGIAAYVTRARRLGHTLLVFDDPVQSMDEDHYRSFAAKLLPQLLDDGFQVIILTHSDRFARDISHHHYLRSGYLTLQTRLSRRKGCQVDEGNRRVAERLRMADKAAEEGDLSDAWRYVRLAIERMYTLARFRADDSFDPEKWRDHDARYMWDNGVESIVETAVPDAGKRLSEILTFAAEGAHDKATRGETDVHDSTDYLRGLLGPLRLGDG